MIAILPNILRDVTQDSLSGTAYKQLILWSHFHLWTDQDLHLATESEQDHTKLPLSQY